MKNFPFHTKSSQWALSNRTLSYPWRMWPSPRAGTRPSRAWSTIWAAIGWVVTVRQPPPRYVSVFNHKCVSICNTLKQNESLNYWPTYRLSITVYCFVFYSILFLFFFILKRFTRSQVHYYFEYFRICRNWNKNCTINNKVFENYSQFTVHSYYVTPKRTYLKYLIRVYY